MGTALLAALLLVAIIEMRRLSPEVCASTCLAKLDLSVEFLRERKERKRGRERGRKGE
jgi:hypothetical protein